MSKKWKYYKYFKYSNSLDFLKDFLKRLKGLWDYVFEQLRNLFSSFEH